MKKLLSLILTVIISCSALTVFAENDEIKVFLDGAQVEFDVAPIIENDCTLVPMRAIAEALGAEVEWKSPAVLMRVEGSKTIELVIDSNEMSIDTAEAEAKKVILDAPACIVDNRTLVPLRAVSEAFDCDVQWDGDTKTVTIKKSAIVPLPPTYEEKLMSNLPQDENYVISPFSLKMAMMMAANGADGVTQQEILNTFHITDITEFNEYAKNLLNRLNTDDKAEVNIANSIWFNKDTGGQDGDFSDTFKNVIKNSYLGVAEAVTNKDSIEKVNEWTEKQTKGKIKDLLSEDSRNYLAALVNAVYMKADWQKQFKHEATIKDIFTDINGKQNEIDFMRQTDYFDYYEIKDSKMVRLPYTNGMSMYIVMGDTDEIGKSISLDETIANMQTKKVSLSIPKFKIEYSKEFNDILKNMGVNKAFTDNAEFSPMIKTIDAKIDKVLQKAIIEVDEKGTEAAAATAVVMDKAAMPEIEEIVEFKADKPFTYYISDDNSGEILFAGRYVK